MVLKLVVQKENPYPLYSCRSVEYKWKNSSNWNEKHHNCTLKRSLRVKETDRKVLNHIISIIKESKKIREEFKVKSLSSKFNEIQNIKKELNRRNKELNNKKKIFKNISG